VNSLGKHALVTGITGQDGAYLSDFLLKKGYEVFGTYRRISTPNFWRLQYLGVFDKVNLVSADLVDAGSMVEAVKLAEPDEIYHLAAQSFVGASFEQPISTGEVTGLGVTRILEAIRKVAFSSNHAFDRCSWRSRIVYAFEKEMKFYFFFLSLFSSFAGKYSSTM